MIKVFGATDKNFSSNGDKVLNNVSAKVHKEDNGDYYIDVEASLEYIDYLVQDNIIVAPTPTGNQAFRLENPTKKTNKISVRGWHVFYDSENLLIEDSYVVDKNCNDALDHLNNATSDTSPFTTISDITSTNSYRCVRKSLYEAIKVVIGRWGGHLVRDNFSMGIRDKIGNDNGVTIRRKKNMQDITCEENWNNVVTKLLPVGKDGLLLPEKYVNTDFSYHIPYTKTQSFQQDIDENDYKDSNGDLNEEEYNNALINDLREQAKKYVEENKYPKVNYTLKANIEKLTDVGDTIYVIDEKLGIKLLTNVISFTFDCNLERYTEIEFGNFKNTLSGLVKNIQSSTNDQIEKNNETIKVTLRNELQDSTKKIWDALGASYCIYEGDKILIVDTLPKENAKNVIMINNGGIGFGQNGINGTFNSAWTIDGTLNMQNINVINFVADMIKGGTLKLGSNLNQAGIIEIYDEANSLIGKIDKNGIRMNGKDGSYVLMNNDIGVAGYDINDNKIYWMDKDEFHMKKSVVEEEITLCNKMRFIPITIKDSSGNVVNDGIGLVSTV